MSNNCDTIESKVQGHLASIITQLRQAKVLGQASVVLVGSAARGKLTWRSDTDFLVVTPNRVRHWRVPVDVHIHFDTRDDFLAKLVSGNDFAGWAVRFGRVCVDPSGWWNSILNERGVVAWPDWHEKVQHARKRQLFACRMLAAGDLAAAEEEYLMATAHIARALLLRAGVFPLSRPEMPAQLVKIGFPEEARLLDRLINGTKDFDELRQIAAFSEQRLNELEQLTKVCDSPRNSTLKKLTK